MAQMPRCRVEVAWETPPRTRPAPEEWTRVDDALAEELDEHNPTLRALTTRRGARLKVAELEAGEAVALIDNRSRAFDPGNASSPWAPNVKPRRRIRFVLEPEGETERTLWTGFIDNLPIGWEVGDGWVELTAVDLLGLIAGDTLPPSALHAETLASAPVAYWPLTEDAGRTAADVVGVYDGSWRFAAPASTQQLIPFASPAQVFGLPSKSSLTVQAVTVRNFRAPAPAVTFAAWFRMVRRSTDAIIRKDPVLQLDTADPNSFAFLGVTRSTPTGPGILSASVFAGADFAWIEADSAGFPDLYDGSPHLLVFGFDSAAGDGFVAVDAHQPVPFEFVSATFPDLSTVAPGPLWFGDRLPASAYPPAMLEDPQQEWLIGHVACWGRLLTGAEIAKLYRAGVNPWADDRTDERLERVLDILGIDPGDRDLDVGTARCAPAQLEGANALEYLRKIVATEPGGALFVDAEGRIAFRSAVANDPAPLATFVGDPDVDAGTPYADVELSYSLDRVVNIAEVAGPGGATQRAENADSIAEYGPLAIELETLHRSPSGARGAGARLTNRYRDPLTVFEALELDGRRDDVGPADTLDLDVGDPVEVIARPTGGGDPLEQLALIEAVKHELDWRSREWHIEYGLAEHVVLPLFEWDTPGRGWDQSVWPDT